MNKLMILGALLSCSAFPVHAENPSILSPSETEGVLERVLDISMMTSVRPIARPASILAQAEDARKIEFSPALSVSDAPLSPFEMTLLSSAQSFSLTDVADPVWLRAVINDEIPAPKRFALHHVEGGLADDIMVAHLGEPEIVLPLDPMVEAIRQRLSGTYEISSSDGDSGYNRLLSLAEGGGYARNAATISAEAYVEDDEEVSQDLAQTASLEMQPTQSMRPTVMGMDPAAAILNSLSKEHLANMTPDQITALVMAAQGRPMDLQALNASRMQPGAGMMTQMAAQPLSGIPSLDYRGDSLPTPQIISASDVPAGSMPFDSTAMLATQVAQSAPEPMRVGDGQNLLLKGWSLGLTGTGEIGMYMVGDPGSIIEISEGMVIGPLGTVQSLTMENGKIIAKFSTGEEMVSPAALVSMASL